VGELRHDPQRERFGQYLRRIRESKKLSLDAVEELAVGYPDRLTKSHLSRIENGRAEPTFRRLYALSQIYGVPVATLAERFELDLHRERTDTEVPAGDVEAVRERVWRLVDEGRFFDALLHLDALLLFEDAGRRDPVEDVRLRIQRVHCLNRCGHHEMARQEAESLLERDGLDARDRVVTLHFLAVACLRQSRFTVAAIAVEHARGLADDLPDARLLRAHLDQTHGQVLAGAGRLDDAVAAFESAMNGFRELGRTLERARATRNLAAVYLDLGKLRTARRFLDEVIRDAERNGHDRHLAFALSDKAVLAWRESDLDGCEAFALRSNRIARERDYPGIVFRNCYYLWRVAEVRSDRAAVRLNEKTLKTYLARVETSLPERAEFVARLTGGSR
jgi:transcriptional regulator with XRE-family HTH domain